MGTWIKDIVFANADEFLSWLDQNFGGYISQHISQNHVHHTYAPNHASYAKYDTLQLHRNMRNYHVNTNGWDDIAQHITIGKDGDIVTGRDIQIIPVSAKGYNGNSNLHPFAYEMIGNFDTGNDMLKDKQLESAIKISRYFYQKGKEIKFHRELLINEKQPKSCPGTGVDKGWFMNLVQGTDIPNMPVTQSTSPTQQTIAPVVPADNGIIGKVRVIVDDLNIRQAPDNRAAINRKANKGEVFDVYANVNDWHNVGGANWIYGNNGQYLELVRDQNVSQPVKQSQPKPPYPNKLYRVQKPMLHDHNVELIQGALNKFFGRQVVKVDGWFGNESAAWIGEFQHRNGLTPDKIVGQHTWNALF